MMRGINSIILNYAINQLRSECQTFVSRGCHHQESLIIGSMNLTTSISEVLNKKTPRINYLFPVFELFEGNLSEYRCCALKNEISGGIEGNQICQSMVYD